MLLKLGKVEIILKEREVAFLSSSNMPSTTGKLCNYGFVSSGKGGAFGTHSYP